MMVTANEGKKDEHWMAAYQDLAAKETKAAKVKSAPAPKEGGHENDRK